MSLHLSKQLLVLARFFCNTWPASWLSQHGSRGCLRGPVVRSLRQVCFSVARGSRHRLPCGLRLWVAVAVAVAGGVSPPAPFLLRVRSLDQNPSRPHPLPGLFWERGATPIHPSDRQSARPAALGCLSPAVSPHVSPRALSRPRRSLRPEKQTWAHAHHPPPPLGEPARPAGGALAGAQGNSRASSLTRSAAARPRVTSRRLGPASWAAAHARWPGAGSPAVAKHQGALCSGAHRPCTPHGGSCRHGNATLWRGRPELLGWIR